MRRTLAWWQQWARQGLPFVLLTAFLTTAFVVVDRWDIPATSSLASASAGSRLGVVNAPQCGSQLGYVGYSVTLNAVPGAPATLRSSLALGTNDLAPEFLPLSSAAPALQADPAAQALGLDRMQLVHGGSLTGLSVSGVLSKLKDAPNVASAEPVWLQSSDPKYLSCDYKLRDNAQAEAIAATASQALISRGVSSAFLDDAGTMEFVSVRHINGQPLIQVAFVQRPLKAPSVAYAVLLNPNTRTVLAAVQANWYLWG